MSANDISIRLAASVSPRSTCSISACSRRRSRSAISSITRRRSAVWASSSSSASETADCAERSSSSRSRSTEARCSSEVVDERRCFGLDPRLGVGDQLLLALLEPPQVRLEALLRAVEVVSPGAQPLVDPARGDRERFRELHAGSAFALGELAPPLVGDLPLLLDERRERVGTHPGETRLQLFRRRRGLLGDERLQLRASASSVGSRRRARACTIANTASANASTATASATRSTTVAS